MDFGTTNVTHTSTVVEQNDSPTSNGGYVKIVSMEDMHPGDFHHLHDYQLDGNPREELEMK